MKLYTIQKEFTFGTEDNTVVTLEMIKSFMESKCDWLSLVIQEDANNSTFYLFSDTLSGDLFSADSLTSEVRGEYYTVDVQQLQML